MPRIERTREIYSHEPEIFTLSGRRVLKRPNLDRHSVSGSLRFGSESRRSTSNDPERLGSIGRIGGNNGDDCLDQTLIGYGSAAEKFLTESQRRLRNILNDSAPKPIKSNVKQPKPIIHSMVDETATTSRGMAKMRLNDDADVSSSDADVACGSENSLSGASDKKAVYFNDNIDYRSPPTLINDD